MDFVLDNLLLLILFTPLVGMAVVMLIPGDEKKLIRWVALIFSLITLAFALVLWIKYDIGVPGYQFEQQAVWYAPIGANFHLGVDGISVSMILLTTILAPLAILASFGIEERVRMYMALFLMLEMGMLGVFSSLDLVVFFLFWEVGLVPMYFLINQWGSANRKYASLKFMIYTMAGSLGLLLSIQVIGLSTGTFSIPDLAAQWPEWTQVLGMSASTVKTVAFWAFTIAFAIKVPMWPFHTWLPDAHTEAPTAGSMILAGVLLKLGAYGFIRLVLPLFPEQAHNAAWFIGLLGVISVVLGAYASYGQTDFKRLIAYSSVNHMGFVVLGIAAAAYVGFGPTTAEFRESALIGLNGAVLQMFNHGLSAASLFFLVGVIYERTHTRDLNKYGGLWTVLPAYGGILIFCAMASVGLPGLNGFVSEFMVVRGAWDIYRVYTIISMLGLLLTGAYLLKALRLVLHGDLNLKWKDLPEINLRERLVVLPLMALMLSIGLWPRWVLEVINATVSRLVG